MSTLGIGKNDVSEYTQSLKDAISNKETENAGLHNILLKRDLELKDLKLSFEQTLSKLTREADRALCLEKDLTQCSKEFKQEQIVSANAEAALILANDKLKAEISNSRDLQCHIDTLSHRDATSTAAHQSLLNDKLKLESRLREMENLVQQYQSKEAAEAVSNPPRRRIRPRSSSVTDMGSVMVEQQLKEARASLQAVQDELDRKTAKFNQLQTESIQIENRANALEKRMKTRIEELESALSDQIDELNDWKSQSGSITITCKREQELLQRIEEDEAKISELEKACKRSTNPEKLSTATEKDAVAAMAQLAWSEARVAELEQQLILAVEKLRRTEKLTKDTSDIVRIESPASVPSQSPPTMLAAEADRLADLLEAVDRLRTERNTLQSNLNFLEAESRFALEARDALLNEAQGHASKAQAMQTLLSNQNQVVFNLQRVVLGLAIISQRQQEKSEIADEHSLNIITQLQMNLGEAEASHAQQITQLEAGQYVLDQTQARMKDLRESLEVAESERDTAVSESAELATELAFAQKKRDELEEKLSIQTEQLTANDTSYVSPSIKQQIQELEDRVTRRTDQISTLQHEIRRLQANMTLQDERVVEMAAELQTMTAEKQAMIEDCASVREAREQALAEVENAEVKMETMEELHAQAITAMTEVAIQKIGHIRSITHRFQLFRANCCQKHSFVDAPASCEVVVAFALARQALASRTQALLLANSSNATLMATIEELQSTEHTEVAPKTFANSENDQLNQETSLEHESLSTLAQLRTELDEETHKRQEIESHLEQVTSDFMRSIEALEEQLTVALRSSEDVEGQSKLARIHQEQLEVLYTKLQEAVDDANTYRMDMNAMTSAHADELSRIATDHQEKLIACISAQERSAAALIESENVRLVDAEAATLRRTALEHEIQQLRLKSIQENDEYSQRVAEMAKECEKRAAEAASASEETNALQTRLLSTGNELDLLRHERDKLTEHNAELQTRILDVIDEIHSKEKQFLDQVNALEELKMELSATESALAAAKQAAKEAEVTLSLQNVQSDRTIAELRREVEAQSLIKTELHERLANMDQLLAAKCVEIEDNDDRIIEMLKDKKKLTMKIDALTRRLQLLQSKVVATLNPTDTDGKTLKSTIISDKKSMSGTVSMISKASIPPVPEIIPGSAITARHFGPSIQSKEGTAGSCPDRIHAVSSSIARPRTPEQKPVRPMVFKARTPEKKASPATNFPTSVSSSSSLSKKRRTPDDFDDIEVPLAARYVESDVENATPRTKRVVNNVQPGFTPVRNATRKSFGPLSPTKTAPARRVVTATGIADITNSPRTDKAKRSWLGKIRGAPNKIDTSTQLGYDGRR